MVINVMYNKNKLFFIVIIFMAKLGIGKFYINHDKCSHRKSSLLVCK